MWAKEAKVSRASKHVSIVLAQTIAFTSHLPSCQDQPQVHGSILTGEQNCRWLVARLGSITGSPSKWHPSCQAWGHVPYPRGDDDHGLYFCALFFWSRSGSYIARWEIPGLSNILGCRLQPRFDIYCCCCDNRANKVLAGISRLRRDGLSGSKVCRAPQTPSPPSLAGLFNWRWYLPGKHLLYVWLAAVN